MPDGTRGPGAACFAVTCDPVLWLCTTQDGSRHGGKEFAPAAETELEAKTEAKAEAEAEEVPVSGWNHKGPRAVCFWDHDDSQRSETHRWSQEATTMTPVKNPWVVQKNDDDDNAWGPTSCGK